MTTQTTTTQAMTTTTNNGSLPADWQVADGKTRQRMVMSIEGGPGDGKTDFALTAPAPIVFFEFDLNCEDTLKSYATQKKIYRRRYRMPDPNSPGAKDRAEKIMADFSRDYYIAIASKEVRSVIWDTATEIWECMRLAAFGRLANVMPHHYAVVNAQMKAMLSAAVDSDTNLILIHRLKDEWAGPDGQRKKTGKKERAGFSDVEFACAVMVATAYDVEKHRFAMTVTKCTQNHMITGTSYTLEGGTRYNSFPFLAADVYGSKLEEWE